MSDSRPHILVGIDFSDSSYVALARARKLAEQMHAWLHLVHIAPGEGLLADTNLALNTPKEFPAARKARISLQKMVLELRPQVDTEVHVRMGASPVAGMLSLIQELKPELVVVGSHGKGLLGQALLGSVSNLLAQRSPVPVVIVPAPGRELLPEAPPPPPEPELPSVGQAVADTFSSSSGRGIAGVGGSDISYR